MGRPRVFRAATWPALVPAALALLPPLAGSHKPGVHSLQKLKRHDRACRGRTDSGFRLEEGVPALCHSLQKLKQHNGACRGRTDTGFRA
jgi:hypothetical protein